MRERRLAAALDVDAVLDALREALPETREGLELESGTVVDVRYRPNGPCWILYRVKVRQDGGRSRRRLLSARLLDEGEDPPTLPAALVERFREHPVSGFRSPVIHLPAVPLVAYPFPLDAALPGLLDAADPRAMRKHLGRLWGHRRLRVRRVNIRRLGYTPQARAAFAYEVLAEWKDTGEPQLRSLVAKMHAKKPAARLFSDAWATWRAADGRVPLAPPVAFIGPAGLTLQERVPGIRLGALVAESGFRQHVRRTARALAALHALRVPLASRRKPEEEIAGIHRWAGVLMAIRPALAPWVERLRDRLAAEVEEHIRLVGPIHADFHHTNVLVDGDRVAIIDLDEMAFGDPMVDVGRFLASLRVPARREFGDSEALREEGERFLEEYLRRSREDGRRARLFEAAALLIAAGSSFRIQRDGWEEETTLLVEQAERVLAEARHGGPLPEGRPDGRPELTEEERVAWATDGVYLTAVLHPHVRKVYGADVARCRVTPRAGGSRTRFDLALEGRRDGERWSVRLRGVHRDGGGKSLLERVRRLRGALDGTPGAPLLPRPVAYVRPLRLLVWQAPQGCRLSALLEDEEFPEATAALGRALAVLQAAPVELDRRRALEAELRKLRRRVERLAEDSAALSNRVLPLLDEVERRTRAAGCGSAPSVRTLDPHRVLRVDGRVALEEVEEAVQAPALLDVGDFLARLTLLGIRRGGREETVTAASRFREAYGEGAGASEDAIAAFEAHALLRLACNRTERKDARRAVPERLLEQAERRLR